MVPVGKKTSNELWYVFCDEALTKQLRNGRFYGATDIDSPIFDLFDEISSMHLFNKSLSMPLYPFYLHQKCICLSAAVLLMVWVPIYHHKSPKTLLTFNVIQLARKFGTKKSIWRSFVRSE